MEKVIWDSGFGYELGYLIERKEFESVVELCTGITAGNKGLFYNSDIKPYSEELQKLLEIKYKGKINKIFVV